MSSLPSSRRWRAWLRWWVDLLLEGRREPSALGPWGINSLETEVTTATGSRTPAAPAPPSLEPWGSQAWAWSLPAMELFALAAPA